MSEFYMKLYVGNLSYSVTEEQLKELFQEYGDVVSAKIIIDRMTNKPKGFGFIEMASREAGEAALAALDGKEFEGRQMKVSEARPPQDRPRRSNNRF